MPENAAGPRIEPPVSEPSAPTHSPAASAEPDPLDEPPGSSGLHGLPAGGKRCPDFWIPQANS